MHGHDFSEGPQRGPGHMQGTGRGRRGCAPAGDRGPARYRFGGRGEGGRGGGQGQQGQGGGRGRGPHGHGPHGHGPGFGPFGRGRGPWARARRGDVRTAILLVIADEPMHGYQIMQRLEERSGGAWRPSPGSVYPTLQLLEDQGLVKGEEAEGRRVFALTDAGREEAEKLKERMGEAPWAEGSDVDPRFALRQEFASLGGAFKQVAMVGSPDDVQKALEILREARRRIYALLADAE
jgi:DNA-binding PadR family transcriptional regulator